MQRITPFLWFDGQAEAAMSFYVSVFKNSKIKGMTRYTGEEPVGTKGSVMTADFELDGQEFVAPGGKIKMDEANHHAYKPVLIGEILKDGQFKVVSRSKGLVKAEPWSVYTSPDKGCDWVKQKGTYPK